MKRTIPFFVIFIFVATLFLSSCGKIDRNNELKKMLDSNESSLNDTFAEETCDYSLFSDYIKSWAKSVKVSVEFSGHSSTVLKNGATENCKDKPSTVLLCDLNTDDVQSSLDTIATAMTCLMGPVDHGDITLVITESINSRLKGIKEVPTKYLEGDNLINLQNSSSDTILVSGPNSAVCTFKKSGSTSSTEYTHAFEISMDMSKYSDPFNFSSGYNYPNPVNTIGSLLASSKSSGKLFDIASFSSKSIDGYAPYSATAVIVTDDNSVESIMNKFDNSYETIKDKFDKIDDDFVYTINEVKAPNKVLSNDISDNLISLMYTLNTGICQQDEESGIIYASSYIQSINTDKGDLDLEINVRTRGESYLDSLLTEYETTAGLCSTDYSCEKLGKIWSSDSKSDMTKFFSQRVPLQEGTESNVSIKTYENDFIAKKLPDENMIVYSFDDGNRKTVMSNIVDFMNPAEDNQ